MKLKLGYLPPTRENVMQNRPSGRLLLDAARGAQDLGFDSVWAGDSLLAKPRHDPLTLLAAVAGAVTDVERPFDEYTVHCRGVSDCQVTIGDADG